ncbi:MAG: response regulator [Chloroflexi bacterium]|nr:response regulator [Chloroflexota bacterium]
MKTKLTFKSFNELFVASPTPGSSRVPAPNEPPTINQTKHRNAIAPARERPETSPHPAPPVRLLPVPRPRILLADDDAGIRESLGKLLRNSGYQVIFAAHGGHVLDRALNEEFGLLVLDLNMPQLDGWKTLNHLASLKPDLPVLVITAQPDQRNWMRDAGARVLMEKPLDVPVFLQTVRNLLDEPKRSGTEARASGTEQFRYFPRRLREVFSNFYHRHWGINE